MANKLTAELLSAASAQGVVTPMQVSQLFMEQRRIREAFVEALRPGGAVVSVYTAELCRQIPDANATAAYVAVNQMLYRRAKEQAEWDRLLTYDQQFRSEVAAKLLTTGPLHAPAAVTALSVEDEAKLVESLLQSKPEGGLEPVVHILASADGHRRWHEALANCWQPGGPVHARLLFDMKQLLPEIPVKHIEGAVARYLDARHDRAVVIAEAMEVKSSVVQQAMTQSLAQDVPSFGQVVVSQVAAQLAQDAGNSLAI